MPAWRGRALDTTYVLRRQDEVWEIATENGEVVVYIEKETLAGYVDICKSVGDELLVTGWAADVSAGQPAESVVFFVGERAVGFAVPDYARPDVAVALDNPELARTGFEATLHSRPGSDETLRVVAVRGDIGTELQVQLRSVTGSGLVAT